MAETSIRFDGQQLQRAIIAAIPLAGSKRIFAKASTRVAFAARKSVMAKLPEIFDRPTRFTINSIRVTPAKQDDLQSIVYISDDAAKGISPRKYLGPEIQGGGRGPKRSERALQLKGMMRPDQSLMPAEKLPLDQFGNVSGPTMKRILSRLAALGEQGYSANVSKATKAKLRKAGLTVQKTGTDYFIAKDKGSGEPLGIWQLVQKGQVKPALIFTDRRPAYRTRFPFVATVMAVYQSEWPRQARRAIHEIREASGSL